MSSSTLRLISFLHVQSHYYFQFCIFSRFNDRWSISEIITGIGTCSVCDRCCLNDSKSGQWCFSFVFTECICQKYNKIHINCSISIFVMTSHFSERKSKKNCHLVPKHQYLDQATFIHSAIYGLGVSFYRAEKRIPEIAKYKIVNITCFHSFGW